MPKFRLTWEETRTATVEADSESAARQCWIDDAFLEDGAATDLRLDSHNLTVDEVTA